MECVEVKPAVRAHRPNPLDLPLHGATVCTTRCCCINKVKGCVLGCLHPVVIKILRHWDCGLLSFQIVILVQNCLGICDLFSSVTFNSKSSTKNYRLCAFSFCVCVHGEQPWSFYSFYRSYGNNWWSLDLEVVCQSQTILLRLSGRTIYLPTSLTLIDICMCKMFGLLNQTQVSRRLLYQNLPAQ